jgi:amidase
VTPSPTDLPLSAAEIVERIASGGTTPEAQVEASLARVKAGDAELNAFSIVLAAEAREEAQVLARGDGAGPLHGVPVAIKEELDVAGCVTTFGGMGNSTPKTEDGEVVRRLRAAGAVVGGKTQMSEFGSNSPRSGGNRWQ